MRPKDQGKGGEQREGRVGDHQGQGLFMGVPVGPETAQANLPEEWVKTDEGQSGEIGTGEVEGVEEDGKGKDQEQMGKEYLEDDNGKKEEGIDEDKED